MYTAYFDGGVSTCQGVGGYMYFDKNSDLAFGQGSWFGERCPTNNVAEMESLLMLMQSLVEHGVPGQVDTVFVIGDSQLIINFANCTLPTCQRPSCFWEYENFTSWKNISVLGWCIRRFCMRRAKWRIGFAMLQDNCSRCVDLAAVAPKLVLQDLPPWRAEESSEHIRDCIGVAGACFHTASLLGSVARAVVGSSFSEASK